MTFTVLIRNEEKLLYKMGNYHQLPSASKKIITEVSNELKLRDDGFTAINITLEDSAITQLYW
jgi:hypothetical protein